MSDCIPIPMSTRQQTQQPRRDVRQEVAAALMERIETGTAPWQMPWDPSLGDDTPVNAATGKPYRGVNSIRLALACPGSDPRWCTFRQAQEKGWQVRRGEHGVVVEKWMVLEDSDKGADAPGERTASALNKPRLAARFYTVFNASQIEGIPELPEPEIPEPEIPDRLPMDPDARLSEAVSRMGVRLRHGGNRA